MEQSGFLSLNLQDFIKGLAMAVLTPAVTVIADSVERGELNFNWRLIVISAIGGGCAYLLKNFLTSKSATIQTDDPIGGGGIKNPPPTK